MSTQTKLPPPCEKTATEVSHELARIGVSLVRYARHPGAMRAFTTVLKGSRGHVRELGAPPTYAEHQYRRAERQHRRAELAAARSRTPGLLASAAGAGVLFGLAGGVPLALEGGGALAGGLLLLALLPNPQHRRPSQQWREHRRQLVRTLRALGDGWIILWDRRLQSAPTPVTIALGDSGIWILWLPEPEWAAQHPQPILNQLVAEIADSVGAPDFAVHSHALYTPSHVTELFYDMIGGVPQAGPDQVHDWAERIDLSTFQEPIVIPAASAAQN